MKTFFKSLIALTALAAIAGLTSGCATPRPLGLVYSQFTEPITVGSGEIRYALKGQAETKSFLAIVAVGDSSINAACQNGEKGPIRKVAWANREVFNICGIFGVYRTKVYGTSGDQPPAAE